MAEEVKDKERTVEKEPELLELIKSVRDQIEQDGQSNVKHVDERYSNSIGYMTFSRNKKKMMSNIMLVYVVDEKEKTGENRVYIQDEKGNYSEIAREVYNTENPIRKRMIKRNGIEFDEEQLSEQIEKAKELQREREQQEAGSDRGGEGRDLPREQHVERNQEEQEEKKDDRENENQNQTQDGKTSEKLENLKGKIEIRDTQQVRLDTLINGFYLYELLQLQDKLKGRLPDGVNERGFRNGYLTMVKSEELTSRDGKAREQEYTFVVQNFNGDTVELDSSVLETEKIGGQQEEQSIAKDQYYQGREGDEVGKPKTQSDLLKKASYRIVGANQTTGHSEDYLLEINEDGKWKRQADTPEDRYTENIVFTQRPRERNLAGAENVTQRNKDEISTYLTGKGENQNRETDRLREEVAEYKPGEAVSNENEYFEKIIDESGIKDYCDVAQVNEARKLVKGLHDEKGVTNRKEIIAKLQEEYPNDGARVLGDNLNGHRNMY